MVTARFPNALRTRLSSWGLFAACAAIFTLVYFFGILTHQGQRVENTVLESATFEFGWRQVLRFVTVPNIAIALVALVALAAAGRRWRTAAQVAAVIGISNALTQLLKYAVLGRPDLIESQSVNTFPSGHTVAFASVLMGAIIASPTWLRPFIAVAATALMATVNVQLLAFGWHRPSDIVGGILLVTAVTALAQAVWPEHPRTARASRWHRPALLVIIAACVVALLWSGGIILWLWLAEPVVPASQLLLLSEIGCALAAAIAIAVIFQHTRITDAPRRGLARQ